MKVLINYSLTTKSKGLEAIKQIKIDNCTDKFNAAIRLENYLVNKYQSNYVHHKINGEIMIVDETVEYLKKMFGMK